MIAKTQTRPQPLAPGNRFDFNAALVPPDGYALAAAIGTTFSMDFPTALTVPVALALRGAMERDEITASPLAALAAMQRLREKVMICVEAGNIHASKGPQSPLVALIEDMVVGIEPPVGGSFHPKIWFLRFEPTEDTSKPIRQRLIIMSRNLTRDRSWDAGLVLDGIEKAETSDQNPALVAFLDWLLPAAKRLRAPFSGLRDGLPKVLWDKVPGMGKPYFHVHFPKQSKDQLWRPGPYDRLAVISPFCDAAGLKRLGGKGPERLVACDDWLAKLGDQRPQVCQVLNGSLLPEADDENVPDPEARSGLHAKLFIREKDDKTFITLGSGNATGAGLNGTNVEVFATLSGKTEVICGIDQMLGDQGLGPLLDDWTLRKVTDAELAADRFDERVRDARRALVEAGPTLEFHADGTVYHATLDFAQALKWPDGPMGLKARLVTTSGAKDVEPGAPSNLGTLKKAQITTFIEFTLIGERADQTAAFVTSAASVTVPRYEERLEALLADVVDAPEKVLRFVTAMLEDRPDLDSLIGGWGGGTAGGQGAGANAALPPVLETLLAAYLAGRDKDIRELDALISKMPQSEGTDMNDFKALWAAFREAIAQ